MRLGFVILSHKPPDEQFHRLLAQLRRYPGARIAVHQDESQAAMPPEIAEKYNLELVRPSMPTQWGHISKVHATLKAFKLLTEGQVPDWFLTLSPNCYPLAPPEQVLSYLEQSHYDTFIEFNPLGPGYDFIYGWHYRTLFTRYRGRIPFVSRYGQFYWRPVRTPILRSKTPFPPGQFEPYTGSDWMALGRKAVERMFDAQLDRHPMLDFLARQNQAPDANASPIEIVLQSFFGNQTDLKQARHNLHYINWEGATGWHPNTLTEDYWQALTESQALFARKFSLPQSGPLIERLEQEYLGQP